MNKIQRKLVIGKILTLTLGVAASLFSVFIFLSEYRSFVKIETFVGVFGAVIGMLVAYAFARIKDATDAPKIFISYSHEDKAFVQRLYEELQGLPFDILWDEKELKVGDNIKIKTEELLDSSDYLLFVSSKNSAGSQWATIEIEKALEMKKKILPVVIDDSQPPEIARQILYADFSSSFENGMNKLVSALRATRPSKTIQQTNKNDG